MYCFYQRRRGARVGAYSKQNSHLKITVHSEVSCRSTGCCLETSDEQHPEGDNWAGLDMALFLMDCKLLKMHGLSPFYQSLFNPL